MQFQHLRADSSHLGIITFRQQSSRKGKYLQKKSMKKILLTFELSYLVSKDKLPKTTVFATVHREKSTWGSTLLPTHL